MKKFLISKALEDLELDRVSYLVKKYAISLEDAKWIVLNIDSYQLQDNICLAMTEFDLSLTEAEDFVTDNPNPSTWGDLEETAESLGVGINEVDDDDVENYMDMGGSSKGTLDSSVGPIQWIYDNTAKMYAIYMALGETPIMYSISPDIMKDWFGSDSIGEYYNLNIRGNITIENNASGSFDPCGCTPNPCEQGQIDQFNARYSSLR
jgi:hypothetical protein